MAKRQTPDLVRIRLDNRYDFDPTAGKDEIIAKQRSSLADFQKHYKSLLEAVQSATKQNEYFQAKIKDIDQKTGLGTMEFVVERGNAENVYNALSNRMQKFYNVVKKEGEPDRLLGTKYTMMSPLDIDVKSGTMQLHGEDAFKTAQARIKQYGGDIWRDPIASKPDRVRYFYPFENMSVASSAEKSAMTRAIFGEAKKISKSDLTAEQQVQAEKQKAQAEKEFKTQQTEERKQLAMVERMNRQFKQAEEAKKKEEKKAEQEHLSKEKKIFTSILAVATIAVDILRRILTAVLDRAVQVQKENVEAQRYGMTRQQRRDINIFDTLNGLPPGTTMGAVGALQNMFGDVTNLDEKALATLARVMGGDITSLVLSGMGGDQPDKLLEKILDKYFSQYKAGKNSLGQDVGQAQALRELATSLASVAPELSELFVKMIADYESGDKGKIGSAKDWLEGTSPLNPMGITENQLKVMSALGDSMNELKTTIANLKDKILADMSKSLLGILVKLNNMRIGETPDQIIAQDREVFQRNKNSYAMALAMANALNTTTDISQTEAEVVASKLGIQPEKIKDKPFNLYTLARIASGEKDKITDELKLGKSEAKDYFKVADELIKNIKLNPALVDNFANMLALLDWIRDYESKASSFKVGQKIPELYFSTGMIELGAENYLKTFGTKGLKAMKPSQMPVAFQESLRTAYTEYLEDNPDYYATLLKTVLDIGKGKEDILIRDDILELYGNDAIKKARAQYAEKGTMTEAELKAFLFPYALDDWYNRRGGNLTYTIPGRYVYTSTVAPLLNAFQSQDSSILMEAIFKSMSQDRGFTAGKYGFRSEDRSGVYTLVFKSEDTNQEVSIELGRFSGEERTGTAVWSAERGLEFTQIEGAN